MLIGLGKEMTSIDFGLTRLKIKVKRVLFCKKWFPLIFLRNVYHRAFIFHLQIGLGEGMAPIDFGFTRSNVKVTVVTFVKKKVSTINYFEKYLIQSFHILHADWSWLGLDLYILWIH